jgi:DNA mismatch repair protein MutL
MAMQHDRISVLPQAVVEKIAAGEVIERPASALKELVENAIDAQATRVGITVENAGLSLIQISDNGTGMVPEDLAASITRHATSKIRSFEDLYALTTMGFRGEALASIAAVARIEICSSHDDSGLGAALTVEGGIAGKVHPCSRTRGTTVVCNDLFYNVPARKKFLKSARSEHLAIVRLIEQIVIPYPGIHFSVTVDGKSAIDVPPVNSVLLRIAQVVGDQTARELVECRNSGPGYDIVIYILPPSEARARPRFQNAYINLRRADCDTVTYAIREAYARFITVQLKPSYFCFLDVDPEKIDVNVHPAKQKVKFDDEQQVFRFVFHTVERCVAARMAGSADSGDAETVTEFNQRLSSPAAPPAPSPTVAETAAPPVVSDTDAPVSGAADAQTSLFYAPADRQPDDKVLDLPLNMNVQLSESGPEESWSLISCFQIHETYILAPIKNGILLIDQHASHERVLFEQALDTLDGGRCESQHLLFPIVVELSPAQKSVITTSSVYFNSFGFAVQDFGGQAVAVNAIPAFMKDREVEGAITGMIGYLMEEKTVRHFPEPQKRFAAAFACGAAIKAGQKLGPEEMNALLNSLFATRCPYTCPHGRPTVVRMSLGELARRFLREDKRT